jgi:hypothetical protein
MESLRADHAAELRRQSLQGEESAKQMSERHAAEMESLRGTMLVQTSAFEAQRDEQNRALSASAADLDRQREESLAARAAALSDHAVETEQLREEYEQRLAALRSDMTLEHASSETAMAGVREESAAQLSTAQLALEARDMSHTEHLQELQASHAATLSARDRASSDLMAEVAEQQAAHRLHVVEMCARRLLHRTVAAAYAGWVEMVSRNRRMVQILLKMGARRDPLVCRMMLDGWMSWCSDRRSLMVRSEKLIRRMCNLKLSGALGHWIDVCRTSRLMSAHASAVAQLHSEAESRQESVVQSEHAQALAHSESVADLESEVSAARAEYVKSMADADAERAAIKAELSDAEADAEARMTELADVETEAYLASAAQAAASEATLFLELEEQRVAVLEEQALLQSMLRRQLLLWLSTSR